MREAVATGLVIDGGNFTPNAADNDPYKHHGGPRKRSTAVASTTASTLPTATDGHTQQAAVATAPLRTTRWKSRRKSIRKHSCLISGRSKAPRVWSVGLIAGVVVIVLFGFVFGLHVIQQNLFLLDEMQSSASSSHENRKLSYAILPGSTTGNNPSSLRKGLKDETLQEREVPNVTSKSPFIRPWVSFSRGSSSYQRDGGSTDTYSHRLNLEGRIGTGSNTEENHDVLSKWVQEESNYKFQIIFSNVNPGQEHSSSSSILIQPPIVNETAVLPQAIRKGKKRRRKDSDVEEQADEVWAPSNPNHGGLNHVRREDPAEERIVKWDTFAALLNSEWDDWEEAHEKDSTDSMDEDMAHYYAFDDDYVRGRRVSVTGDPPEDEEPTTCRRVHEHRLSFPNCNAFHQLDYAGEQTFSSGFTFLNEGTFREVFGFLHNYSSHFEHMALKEIHYDDINGDDEYYEYIRMDALVAERFANHPRTFDIYGYCGLSILSEYFYHGDIEDWSLATDDEMDVATQILSPAHKIILGLEMARGLQVLHDHETARIIHGDVQMGQFLLNRNMTMLKLNDFNRAEFQLWDDAAQGYCRHRNGKGHGDWRAPEEYRNDALTEKVDVWSLGNNLYSILTGDDPIFNEHREISLKQKQLMIVRGKKAIIPQELRDKSEPERVLAAVIEECWAYKPEDRPSMADIVEVLEIEVRRVERALGRTRTDILQTLQEQDEEVDDQ